MPEADIRWENIKTLHYFKVPGSEYGYELRLGRWIKDGRPLDIILTKQEFRMTTDGYQIPGKLKGLTANDLYRVFQMSGTISKVMGFPLPNEMAPNKDLGATVNLGEGVTSRPEFSKEKSSNNVGINNKGVGPNEQLP